ncbi:MAG: hypothetical protein ACOC44_16290 [Promethearchaeia archaeon]
MILKTGIKAKKSKDQILKNLGLDKGSRDPFQADIRTGYLREAIHHVVIRYNRLKQKITSDRP